jgi:hypothetical protein
MEVRAVLHNHSHPYIEGEGEGEGGRGSSTLVKLVRCAMKKNKTISFLYIPQNSNFVKL